MKKSFLLLSMLFVSAITFAQVSFKTDGGIHGGFSFGDVKMYGIGASLEPKVFITPKFSAGARFEGTVLFGGLMHPERMFLQVYLPLEPF
jgi:hypothetical protein